MSATSAGYMTSRPTASPQFFHFPPLSTSTTTSHTSKMSLRSLRRLTPLPTTRLLFSRPASTFRPTPAPPKLPADEQAEFERLQRDASVSSAFQPQAEPSPSSTVES